MGREYRLTRKRYSKLAGYASDLQLAIDSMVHDTNSLIESLEDIKDVCASLNRRLAIQRFRRERREREKNA